MSLIGYLAGSPDRAVLLALAGVLLIYVELNRPGSILFGAAGITAVLLAIAGFCRLPVQGVGLAIIAFGLGWQVFNLRRRVSWWVAIATGVILFVGFWRLLPGRIHLPVALAAGLVLGPGTSLLTAIAWRARVNKGLDS